MSKEIRSQRRETNVASRTKKSDTLAGGELQGRAGDTLPTREKTVLGNKHDWERSNDDASSVADGSPANDSGSDEIEYERGPGSKFDIEGRGLPRSKRQRARRSK